MNSGINIILFLFNIIKNMKNFLKLLKLKYIFIFILILIELITLIYNNSKEKQLKICLCVIGKNENLYVKEFVNHYKNLGYNKIFIYDNNDINDERFEDIIQDEINNDFVSIINYRGYKKHQFFSYQDCYERNNSTYNWLSFFDFDEFLEIKSNNKTIQSFLNNKRFKYCQNIKINWVFYVNMNSLYYDKRPIQQRVNSSIIADKHIKSTVRGNLSINYWYKTGNPHSSGNKFISCSSSGKQIPFNSPFNEPPDIKFAFLKHYWFKSFEEFCIKLKKGKADSDNYNLSKKIMAFYQQNKYDINKLNIMKKIFNLSLNINKNNLNN